MITFEEMKTRFKMGTIYYEVDWGDCQEMKIITRPILIPKKDVSELDVIYWYATINGGDIVKNKATELSKLYGLFWERKPSRIPDFSAGSIIWD